MSFLAPRPLFVAAAGLLVVGLAGEIRAIFIARKATVRAQARLSIALRGSKELEAARPAPTEESAVTIEIDRARLEQILAGLRAELTPPQGSAGPGQGIAPPTTRTEAFFELATFVDQLRDQAARSGVALKPDERFGFSAYAAEAPGPELIAAVFRQRLIVQHCLDALLDARPRSLISVQREPPAGPVEPSVTRRRPLQPGSGDRLSPDLFVMDPRLSVRMSGVINPMGFRFVFVGTTETLRTFLNRLARFELPVVVRCVEVEPAVGSDAVRSEPDVSRPTSMVLTTEPAGPVADAPLPVVVPAPSKITVTVEFIEFVAGSGPAT